MKKTKPCHLYISEVGGRPDGRWHGSPVTSQWLSRWLCNATKFLNTECCHNSYSKEWTPINEHMLSIIWEKRMNPHPLLSWSSSGPLPQFSSPTSIFSEKRRQVRSYVLTQLLRPTYPCDRDVVRVPHTFEVTTFSNMSCCISISFTHRRVFEIPFWLPFTIHTVRCSLNGKPTNISTGLKLIVRWSLAKKIHRCRRC